MATALTLPFSSPDGGGGSMRLLVQDDFDACFNKLQPLQPATSQLEARQNFLYTKVDGDRICIAPSAIVMIEENAEEA